MPRTPLNRDFESIRSELLQNPEVVHVTYGFVPASSRLYGGETEVSWEGKDLHTQVAFNRAIVWYDYLETFRMEIVQGRNFSRTLATDETEAFIVNETAVKTMGLAFPIGKRLSIRERQGKIIGVVKDFHWASLHHPIEPLIFHIGQSAWTPLLVRIRPGGIPRVLVQLRNIWEKANPPFPFTYEFVDERVDNLYYGEHRIGVMFNVFTLIAVFISCLGLLGLASFMIEKRTKEIGIRKILGAPVYELVNLLSMEFGKWIILANVMAWPTAYLAMNRWLQNFSYRIALDIVPFILSACFALVIVVLTVGYHALKAARANPIEALKYE